MIRQLKCLWTWKSFFFFLLLFFVSVKCRNRFERVDSWLNRQLSEERQTILKYTTNNHNNKSRPILVFDTFNFKRSDLIRFRFEFGVAVSVSNVERRPKPIQNSIESILFSLLFDEMRKVFCNFRNVMSNWVWIGCFTFDLICQFLFNEIFDLAGFSLFLQSFLCSLIPLTLAIWWWLPKEEITFTA